MKSKSLAAVQWVFLLVAVISWIYYFFTGEGWIPLVVASVASVVFGVMLALELFD
jgi:hypothetical protein